MTRKNQNRVAHAACRRGRGFTLMEVLMASVVLTIGVAAVSQSVNSGQAHAYESLHRMRSAAIGQALMEEVTALPYPAIEPGAPGYPATPGRRSLFDSMDDFNGYVEAATELKDQAGRDYDSEYQTFARKVTVETDTVSIVPIGDVPGLQITVTVIDQRGQSWEIVRFMPRPTAGASE